MDSLIPALGRLSLFPREVRDKVYRHVFSPRYLTPRPGVMHHCMDNYSGRRIRNGSRHGEFVCANIGILKTSRVLRKESAEIFYSKCMFIFTITRILEDENDLALLHLAYHEYPIPQKEEVLRLLRHSLQRPKFGIDVPSTMKMRNIELCIDVDEYADSSFNPGEAALLDAITNHLSTIFGGSQSIRESCRIMIYVCPVQAWRLAYGKSTLKSLKALVGFSNLIIVFIILSPDNSIWAKHRTRDPMSTHAIVLEALSSMREAFEAVLGPATVADNIHSRAWSRSFEFRPHDHLTRL